MFLPSFRTVHMNTPSLCMLVMLPSGLKLSVLRANLKMCDLEQRIHEEASLLSDTQTLACFASEVAPFLVTASVINR